MPERELDSTDLRDLVVRVQAGDRGAEDRLIRAILGRFQSLARRMFNQFPDLRQREQIEDVVQDALMRLLRALKGVTPQTSRDFFNLAAEQIRRQLLDLARHHRRATTVPLNPSDDSSSGDGAGPAGPAPPPAAPGPGGQVPPPPRPPPPRPPGG